ncbi:MAG: bifunctional phosphopantothenoylcysteine decarboxylase/phosphopantothenate--cysteine ligase CoaBC [Candidatus Eisenbacteria bacterium]
MLNGRVVVVGVSGGIAAYKACELVRRLRDHGATVIVIMTPAAQEFVTSLTFQALSGNPVVTHLWGDQKPSFDLPLESRAKVGGKVEHVDVAEVADCVVIAPATADLMARLVHGEAPDALTCMVLATPAPIVIAPAMDLRMWSAAPTQRNVRELQACGYSFVGPDTGALASGLSGPGRLAETADIVLAVERAVAHRIGLRGVRVLVGAGRTEEAIDPVRVITNRSSGRMGFALAEAARDRGAQVTVVAGPVSIPAPFGVTMVPVTTSEQMQRAMRTHADQADVVLMAAAVSDYRPTTPAREKLKRSSAAITLKLTPNADILAGLGAARRKGQVLVGFALETHNGVANARKKLIAKRVDLIVLNAPGDGLGGDTNRVTLVDATRADAMPMAPKREVAEAILDRVADLRAAQPGRSRKRAVAVVPKPKRKPASRAAAKRRVR